MYIFKLVTPSLLLLLVMFICLCNAITIPPNDTIPALIVFGDSIVDPGNNNHIQTIARCDFPPYGRDLPPGNPTGRFSNGKVPSDILAELFGLKELLPPYLDPNLQPRELVTGVSFASGGSGYDPLTSELATALSLADQLELFREYVSKISLSYGKDKSATILSKAIFVLLIGSNDIANTYRIRMLTYDISSYTDLMLGEASSFLEQLYQIGARRIGVVSLPPIGCLPSQRTLGGGLNKKCADQQNEAAQLFNAKLSAEIDSLKYQLSGSRLVYLDIYNPLLSLILNPSRYGFEVSKKGCCGTGNIEVSISCTSLEDSKTCKDASKFVFWDSYHPSEEAYKTLVPMLFDQKTVNEFF